MLGEAEYSPLRWPHIKLVLFLKASGIFLASVPLAAGSYSVANYGTLDGTILRTEFPVITYPKVLGLTYGVKCPLVATLMTTWTSV